MLTLKIWLCYIAIFVFAPFIFCVILSHVLSEQLLDYYEWLIDKKEALRLRQIKIRQFVSKM